VFAPAAAHLASGIPAVQFGKVIRDYVRSWNTPPLRLAEGAWRGTILRADRFGNLITNFHIDEFAGIKTRPFELRAGTARIRRLALNYAETEIGELFVIAGSSGYVEIAANQASAGERLGCSAGAAIELELY
jgi:S-adenosylmethionine hydrolase